MDSQLPNPPKVTLYTGLSILVVFTIICLFYFVSTLVDMSQQWGATPGIFMFNKGVFYIPGIVLGLLVLIFVIVYESVLRKHLTEKIASICTRTGIGAVALMFVVPNIADYSFEKFLTKQNYQICVGASHQWLHSKIVAYTNDEITCDAIVEKE